MKHIVQFSGGAGSWGAAKLVVQYYGADDTLLLFADTRIEDEDLYRFLIEASADVGAPLKVIADGRNPWEIFTYKRFLGNSRVDPCSRILKRELCYNYIKENWGPEDCRIYVGIDWTEEHRMKNVHTVWAPYQVVAPLCHPPYVEKQTLLDSLQQAGIKLPRLYSMGFPHNNCGGFCIKAGKAHFLNLLDKMPERYKWHEEQEEALRQQLGKDVTILREQKGKQKFNLSLKQLRERAEEIRQTEDGQLDWGGCGCFVVDSLNPLDELEMVEVNL